MVTVDHARKSAALARHELAEDLAGRGLPPDLVENATLLVSELIGNAVRYARPLPGGVLRVSWSLLPDCLLLQVTDGGGPDEPRYRQAGPFDVRGRGLTIVEALSRKWGVDRHENGVGPASTVWAELPIGAPH